MKQKILKFIKFLVFITMLVVVCGIASVLLLRGCTEARDGSSYSQGNRTGVVVKFARRGIKYKIWEGELTRGGGATSIRGNTWEFTVPDGSPVVQQIQDALDSGERVKLHYTEGMWNSPLSGSPADSVDAVTKLNNPDKKDLAPTEQ